MRKADPRDGWFRNNVLPLFPERQVILRSRGRIRYVALSTGKQLAFVAVVLAGVLTLAASLLVDYRAQAVARYENMAAEERGLLERAALEEEKSRLQARLRDEQARREAELAEMRRTYLGAFERLEEFDRTFADVAAEIDRIDASLRVLSAGADAAAQPAPAVLASVAAACPRTSRDKVRQLQAEIILPPPPRKLPPTTQVQARLDRLRRSHRAFIEYYVEIASERIGEIEKALAAVGLSTDDFLGERNGGAYAVGGPFVPMAGLGTAPGFDGGYLDTLGMLDLAVVRWNGLATALGTLPFGKPIDDGWVSSRFGRRKDPINGLSSYHKGLDFGGPWRAPIRATGDGVVAHAGPDGGYGNVVEIDHGMGITTRYAHLACVLVEDGQKVRRSTVVGLMGASGRTKGAHLHYEVRVAGEPRDPQLFLSAGNHVLKR